MYVWGQVLGSMLYEEPSGVDRPLPAVKSVRSSGDIVTTILAGNHNV